MDHVVLFYAILWEQLTIGFVTTIVYKLYVLFYFTTCFGTLWPSSGETFTHLALLYSPTLANVYSWEEVINIIVNVNANV
jgi:hypothetical protein